MILGGRNGIIGRGGFLGNRHAGFVVSNLDHPLNNISAPDWMAQERLIRRENLLEILNQDFESRVMSSEIETWRELSASAFDFMQSDKLDVFDLTRESANIRAKFGDSWSGKAFLLALRLARQSVPFIEISIGGWDTHSDHRNRMNKMLSELDKALATFLGEAGSSGLLSQTLFVLNSEFGRTPDLASNGDGRDHYPQAWTSLMGGGSMMKGAVYGSTDEKGARVTDPVSPADFMATLYTAAGLDYEFVLKTSAGRPFQLVDSGSPVASLLGG
jgi:uncharacterized protein (DUF1501 family)